MESSLTHWLLQCFHPIPSSTMFSEPYVCFVAEHTRTELHKSAFWFVTDIMFVLKDFQNQKMFRKHVGFFIN